jgi:hypothetical protein
MIGGRSLVNLKVQNWRETHAFQPPIYGLQPTQGRSDGFQPDWRRISIGSNLIEMELSEGAELLLQGQLTNSHVDLLGDPLVVGIDIQHYVL